MGLEPLRQFVCDKCGEVIETVEDGWLEWFDNYETPAQGFRIVHSGGPCYYPDSADVSDNHLVYFTGPDGQRTSLACLIENMVSIKVNSPRLSAVFTYATTRRLDNTWIGLSIMANSAARRASGRLT